jgi:competence protein ComEA
MRRESTEEVTAAAHRRLEELGRELSRSGTESKSDQVEEQVQEPVDETLVLPVVVGLPGRHSRHRVPAISERTRDRLSGWFRGRFRDRVGAGVPQARLRTDHLPVVAALAAAALVGSLWFALRGSPEQVPVARTAATASGSPAAAPVAGSGARSSPGSTTIPGPSTGPATGPAAGSAAGPAAGTVVVDVAGKVRRPGVATLPAGSRVIDALRRAGGARRGVDLSALNLARVLVDGEQILVGRSPARGTAAAASTVPGAPDGALVNLNTADLAALDSLPGVGPVTAQKILDWRTEHGAFSAVDELLEVDGIGARTLAEMAPRVTL